MCIIIIIYKAGVALSTTTIPVAAILSLAPVARCGLRQFLLLPPRLLVPKFFSVCLERRREASHGLGPPALSPSSLCSSSAELTMTGTLSGFAL